MSLLRTRWAAIGAAVAIALGAGGIGIVSATVSSGERTVFVPITPCRIMDTCPGFVVGSKTSPLGPEETSTVDAHGTNGQCTLPSDASGLVLNVTATDATLATFLVAWGDGTRPNASSLNPSPGQPPTPNAVTTDLTSAGEFKLFNKAGTVNVFVDVVGYYANHNHDDRYYTKSQTNTQVSDALENQPWSIHIAPSDLAIPYYGFPNAAVTSLYGLIGLAIDDGGFDQVLGGFQLPWNYTSGADLRIAMHWLPINGLGTHVFPCNVVFGVSSYALRAGAPAISTPASWASPWEGPGNTRLTATANLLDDQLISETYVTIDGTDLQPGDMLNFDINRIGDETVDTCQGIMITGMEAFES